MKNDKPSATAMVVAAGSLSVAQSGTFSSLVSAEWKALLQRLVTAFPGPNGLLLRILAGSRFRGFVTFLERFSIPGLSLHFVLRKRALESAARAALTEGFEQLVVLGGGFDTLTLRLAPTHPSVSFFELDHPATQRVKTQTLSGELPNNLQLAPVDFTTQAWQSVLLGIPEYSRDKATVFLCEGVLMYLSASQVDAVFSAIRQCSPGRALMLFTFMELQANGRPHFRHATVASGAWLRGQREPYLWGLAPADLRSFLTERGFTLRNLLGADELRADIKLGASVSAAGEWVAIAEKADS